MSQSLLLHHFPLDPASRQTRLALGEKKLAFDERPVRYWEFDEVFHALSPTGRTPVLEVGKGEARFAACELLAVLDWIETQGGKPALLPADPLAHSIEFNKGFVELCRLHSVKAAYIMADTTDALGRTRLIGGGDQELDAFLTRLLRSTK